MLQNHSTSVYILGIVHVCLGICLLAASTNKTKKSLLSQNKLPLDMSKKLYLPHPPSVQSSVLPASLALPLFGATRKKLPTQLNPLITPSRAAKEDLLQARLPQWQPHHRCTIAAAAHVLFLKFQTRLRSHRCYLLGWPYHLMLCILLKDLTKMRFCINSCLKGGVM